MHPIVVEMAGIGPLGEALRESDEPRQDTDDPVVGRTLDCSIQARQWAQTPGGCAVEEARLEGRCQGSSTSRRSTTGVGRATSNGPSRISYDKTVGPRRKLILPHKLTELISRRRREI